MDNTMSKPLPAIVAGLLALAGPAGATDDTGQAAAAKLAAELCSVCHGPGGHSQSPVYPVLAAQQAEYLEKQLKAFRDHSRGEPVAHDFMWGIARGLDDRTIAALAAFFAAQPPPPGEAADAALAARGRKLYEEGAPDRQIAACSACHGPQAAGAGLFPRLAGQHPDYVVKQLQFIQNALREVPAMHGLIQQLTPEDMRAVAAYVASR
jgi:cytochrome c553